MAPLCWIAVTLTLTLSAAVDQNQLQDMVRQIVDRYRPSYTDNQGNMRSPMFSVAVSIPYNRDRGMYDFSQVRDSETTVKETILQCKVYRSSSMVAATVLRWPNVTLQCPNEPVQWPDVLRRCGQRKMTWQQVKERCNNEVYEGRADHAEYRIFQHFDSFNNHGQNHLMLFYVLASPCDQRCTSQSSSWSILQSIRVIREWADYAVVFSNVFKPTSGHDIPEENRRAALQRLGESVGLGNIYRCRREQGRMQCASCSSDNRVARYCFTENQIPGSNLASASFRKTQHCSRNPVQQSADCDLINP